MTNAITKRKHYREFSALLDQLRLETVTAHPGGRHYRMMLRNKHGATKLFVLSYGSERKVTAWSNIRGELKRFADKEKPPAG